MLSARHLGTKSAYPNLTTLAERAMTSANSLGAVGPAPRLFVRSSQPPNPALHNRTEYGWRKPPRAEQVGRGHVESDRVLDHIERSPHRGIFEPDIEPIASGQERQLGYFANHAAGAHGSAGTELLFVPIAEVKDAKTAFGLYGKAQTRSDGPIKVELHFNHQLLPRANRADFAAAGADHHLGHRAALMSARMASRMSAKISAPGGLFDSEPRVLIDHPPGFVDCCDLPLLQQHSGAAERLDGGHIMADEEDGPPLFGDIAHFSQAFFLKHGVADRQNFVHQQDLSFQMGRDGEGEPNVHSA